MIFPKAPLLWTALALIGPSLLQANTVSSPVTVTSWSIFANTAYSPDDGGKWTYLSTPNFFASWPQGWTTQMSGEIMPDSPGSSSYSSDYAGFGGGAWALYGKLTLTLPFWIDSDGDSLPDFLERNLGFTGQTTTGVAADEWHIIPANRSTNLYNFSFSRTAGSFSGSYSLKASHEFFGWSGNFQLKGATGTITFNTASNTFTVALTSFDGMETNGGSGSYQRLVNGTLQCQGFTLTSSYGSGFSRSVQSFSLAPISGNRVSGTLVMNDGHPSTPYADYVAYHVELSNPPGASSRILYVRQNASGSNNGSSWANAYTSLQSAIDAAAAGDQIWVAAGTYRPTTYLDPKVTTDPRSRSFVLRNGTQIFGGFSGTESSLNQRNSSTQNTILSGDFNANDSSIWPPDSTRNDNAYHVVAALGVSGAVLDGITITGGNANNTTYAQPNNGFLVPEGINLHKYGGALLSFYAPVEIRNSTIRRNAAAGSGGGILLGESGSAQLEIRSTLFEENLCTGNGNNGGAMDIGTGCTLRLVDCQWVKNQASQGGALSISGYPGGAEIIPPRVSIVRCLFRENQARLEADSDSDGFLNYGDGGAVYADYDAEVVVAVSAFTGNFINQNGFTNPNSGHGGAIAVRQNASLKIAASVFTGNQAPWAGGALDVSTWTGPDYRPGKLEIYFSTFFSNQSLWGGALNNYYGQLSGAGNIFYGNLTTEPRGTAEVNNANSSTSTITHSLVTSGSIWGNTGYVIGANPFFSNPALPAGVDETWFTSDDGLRITVGSIASGIGGNSRPPDFADVDGDADVLEPLPLDAQGSPFPSFGPYHAGGYQSLVPATALPPHFPLPPGAYFYTRANSGNFFSYQAYASNAVAYSFPGLPAGLTGSAGGLISGIVSIPGTYWFNIVASNANGSATNQMVLYTLPAPANLPFSESFATNPASRFLFVPSATATLPWSSANGRLDYSAPADASSPEFGNFVQAVPNLGLSLSNNWEISVDVRLPSLSPATDGSPYEAVGLALVPDDPDGDLSAFSASLISLELGHGTPPSEELDGFPDNNFICAYARSDGQDILALVDDTPTATQATLRFQYQASTKSLVTSYRTLPSGAWVATSTNSLNPAVAGSIAARWGLSNTSVLRVALWADSYRSAGLSTGQIWLDNFSAVDSSQSISFPSIPIKTIGDPAFTLSATASSGLPVTYTSSQTNVATVSGNTVTLRGPGATLVTASQAGNSSWGPASASQWLLVWGIPINTAPFSDDFSSATANRYFPLEDTNSGARFRITNGYALFSTTNYPGYESPGGLTPNLALRLTNNWALDIDAHIPTNSTPYTALYFSILKDDAAFLEVPTGQNYRVKVTTLKLVRENTTNSVRVNAHDYALIPSWDFDGPSTNVASSNVSLRWIYTATNRELECWYDADTTNNSGHPWRLLHRFSLATNSPDSLGTRWGLANTNQLYVSLSAVSEDPGGTANRPIYFDNFSYRTNSSTAAPTLSAQPVSSTLTAGQSATFFVTATGTGPFTYQWRLNGTNLVGATASTYTVASVNSSHAGSYTVVVSNSGGSVTSSAASLNVLPVTLVASGKILTPSGTAFANLRLDLRLIDPLSWGALSSGTVLASTNTSADGSFQFSLDRAKDYLISAAPTSAQAAVGIPLPLNISADSLNASLDLGSIVSESTSRTVEVRLVNEAGTPLSGTALTTASSAPLFVEFRLFSDQLVLWQLQQLQLFAGLTPAKLTPAAREGLRTQAATLRSALGYPNNASSAPLSWSFLSNPPASLPASLNRDTFLQITANSPNCLRYDWTDFNALQFELPRNSSNRYTVPVLAAPSTDPRVRVFTSDHYLFEEGAIELQFRLQPNTTNFAFLGKRLDLNATNLPLSTVDLPVRDAPRRISGKLFLSNGTTPLTNAFVILRGIASAYGYQAGVRTDSLGNFAFPAFSFAGEWSLWNGNTYSTAYVPIGSTDVTNVSLVQSRVASVTSLTSLANAQTLRITGSHLQTIDSARLLSDANNPWVGTDLSVTGRDSNLANSTYLDLGIPPDVPSGTYWIAYKAYFNQVGSNVVPPLSVSIQRLPSPTPPAPLTNGLRANLGVPFSYTPAWSNSPTSFSVANLPPGLTINASTGAISGTPTQAGYYLVTQTASNSAGTATFTIPITIPGALQTFPFTDTFTNTVANRYMPFNLESPASLTVTGGVLRYASALSDGDGALAGWVPNLPLALTNSWDLVVDAQMPAGWSTPYSAVGITLLPQDDTSTLETSAYLRRLNLKFGRDTQDSLLNGNYFARAAYTNDVEYVFPPTVPGASLPYVATNTPATRATLRYSYHAPTWTLSTWYRINNANAWEPLGTPFNLNPATPGSLGNAWGLSNASTLRVALWGDSDATNGSASQPMELDNFSATLRSGRIEPTLPATLIRPPGQPLFLSASPRDVGSYTYNWRRNGINLPPVSSLGLSSHVAAYYIPNPTTADNGTYELIITKDGQPYGTNTTVLTISTNAPTAPANDDFSTNIGRWNGVFGFDAPDSFLRLAGGRLHYVSDQGGSENTQAYYFWDSLLPTDRTWEVSVEANLAAAIAPPLQLDYFYHALRLNAEIPVHHGTNPFVRSGLQINFAEDKDGFGNRRRFIQNGLKNTNSSSGVELAPNALTVSQTNVGLRLRYDSTTKTITSFYRTSPSGGWLTAASNNLSSLPVSQLTNGFRLTLGGIAEPSFLIQEGQAFFDNFQLTYFSAPTISVQPLSSTVSVGQAVTLSVTASGNGPFTYQWRLNGTNISGATGASYTIPSANASHGGSYSVVVTDPFGSVTSSTASLNVHTPPVVTNQPAFFSQIMGPERTFSVTATGTGPFTYQWRLNGANLSAATNSTLALSAINLSQAGAYSVVVTGPGGSTTNLVALLAVHQGPVFNDDFSSIRDGWIFLGETNRFSISGGVLGAGSALSSARPPALLVSTDPWLVEVDCVISSSAPANTTLALSLHPELAETATDLRPAHRLDLVFAPSGTNRILQPIRYVGNVASNLPALTLPHQAGRMRLANSPTSGQLSLMWRPTNGTWTPLTNLPFRPGDASLSNNLANLWNLNSTGKLRINLWGCAP